MKPQWIDDLVLFFGPYLPPAFGAFVGARYTRDQPPLDRVLSAVCGFGLGVWLGGAAAEYLQTGPKITVAMGILISMLGMDVVGIAFSVIRQFKNDPLGSFKAWWAAWTNRSSGG